MNRLGGGLAVGLALLAGCGAVDPPTTRMPRSGAQFSPDANGLAVVGSGQRIDFGRAPSGVIAALDRELGQGTALGLNGCSVGIVTRRDWDGLVLTFTNERFVGWRSATGSAGQTCATTA